MNTHELEEMISINPRLYHVTTRGSWGSMMQFGLLSARGLEDRYRSLPEQEQSLVANHMRRLDSLEAALDTPREIPNRHRTLPTAAWKLGEEWYERMNVNAFFFLSQEDAEDMVAEYQDHLVPRDMLVVSTESLIEAHRGSIELSAIHSCLDFPGRRVPPNYPLPGRPHDALFCPIADYPYGTWRKLHGRREAVRELAVVGGVPDIARHVIDVVQMTDGAEGEQCPWWAWGQRREGDWAALGLAAPALG